MPTVLRPAATFSRDRYIALSAIVVLSALAWAYMFHVASSMDSMVSGSPAMSAMQAAPMAWGITDFTMMFAMWSVMMVAMMLPSATPMILLFTKVSRAREADGRPRTSIGLFVLGYVLAWTGFSVLATTLNWWLHVGGQLTFMMGRVTPIASGIVLISAGLFQWSPWKYTCLDHCRSPIAFLTTHWREGVLGPLRMGLHHGDYCLGCCWLLMALLFVLGVMNLVWIAVLTSFILLEKIMSRGRLLSRAAGVGMIAWGGWLIVQG